MPKSSAKKEPKIRVEDLARERGEAVGHRRLIGAKGIEKRGIWTSLLNAAGKDVLKGEGCLDEADESLLLQQVRIMLQAVCFMIRTAGSGYQL